MRKIGKLMKEVRQILVDYPNARNDDGFLIEKVIHTYYRGWIVISKSGAAFVKLINHEAFALASKIERCRRKIQETELMPTDIQVAKKRRINEEVWRNYMLTL